MRPVRPLRWKWWGTGAFHGGAATSGGRETGVDTPAVCRRQQRRSQAHQKWEESLDLQLEGTWGEHCEKIWILKNKHV